MKIKYLPLAVFFKLGFKPPYWMTAPMQLLRYGAFWKRSKKCPEYKSRNDYYDFVIDEHIGDRPIVYLEFGVFKGQSIRHWSAKQKHSDSLFFGFDSFVGLPTVWKHFHRTYDKSFFDVDGAIPEIDDPRVSFIKGFFQDTLDDFIETHRETLESAEQLVIHCDADLYSATLYVLTRLNSYLRPGTVILFDEFYSVEDEFRAVMDYQLAYNREFEPIASVYPFFQRLAVRLTK